MITKLAIEQAASERLAGDLERGLALIAGARVAGDTASLPAPPAPTAPPAILLGRHHDITAFASRDPNRFVINSVHYNHQAGCIEATNGVICIRVPVVRDVGGEFPPVSVNGEAKDCIIPLAPFRKGLANIPKSALPITEHLRLTVSKRGGVEQVNMVTTDLDTEQVVGTRVVEGNYPSIDKVIPAAPTTLKIQLGSELLKLIADYAERYGKPGTTGGCPITLEFMGALDPVRFSLRLDTPEWTLAAGVMMPMRGT